jgi:TolB-like protein
MLTGRVPFAGKGMNAMMATLHEQPPALQGGPEIVALDRVIRRAMRKQPSERYARAAEMAAELAGVSLPGTSGMVVPVRALTRIIVPPLKIAKPDPDVSYLSFGLADSVSGALASLGDVVVRAPSLAARWSDSGGDPRSLRTEADVDLIVTGTLLRSGPQVRITVQLLDASAGTVLGSTAVKGTLDDVFALEDGMATAAMQLAAAYRRGTPAPTTAAGARRREIPATPRAFELFLRGMEHARTLTGMLDARKCLQDAVEEDPQFAPAWAALGRCHRVYGKYYEPHSRSHEERADAAFRRALELSPQLPLAHRYLTHF